MGPQKEVLRLQRKREESSSSSTYPLGTKFKVPSYSKDEDNNFIQAFMRDLVQDESTNQKNDNNNLWFFDTSTTHHLSNNQTLLHNYRLLSQLLEVRFGDNGMKVAINIGEVYLSISHSKSISIPNVYGLKHTRCTKKILILAKKTCLLFILLVLKINK